MAVTSDGEKGWLDDRNCSGIPDNLTEQLSSREAGKVGQSTAMILAMERIRATLLLMKRFSAYFLFTLEKKRASHVKSR